MQIQRDILKEAGISQENIRQLETAWDAYQVAAAQPIHQVPHIVCTGIYNAGKSTLLNALCGEEKFPTGDIPTTKQIAQAEFGGAVYIDTPGLNAMDEDDREAQAAYESADFILFVANAQNGGISAAEAEWLHKLKDRYGNTLRRRLIYVLTHCAQVEPEQLQAIREKTFEDFKKAAGFDLAWFFCGDSITYQDGVIQNEPLLTESSAIPRLKSCLDERIAGAEKILREMREAELADRREDLTKRLEHYQKFCRGKIQESSSQKQSADIKTLFDTTKKTVTKALSDPVEFFGFSFYVNGGKATFEGRNRGDLKRSARESVRNYIRKELDEARRSTKRLLEYVESYYGNVGLNSAYFKKCDEISRVLEELQAALAQREVHLDTYQEIHVQPNDISSLSSELTEMDFYNSGYWSANRYFDVFENRIEESKDEYGYEERGLFGSTKWVPKYCIFVYGAISEIQDEINKTFQGNMDRVQRWIDGEYWQPFLKELRTKATKRLTEMQKAADAMASEAGQVAEKPYKTALEHLNALQKEVSQ